VCRPASTEGADRSRINVVAQLVPRVHRRQRFQVAAHSDGLFQEVLLPWRKHAMSGIVESAALLIAKDEADRRSTLRNGIQRSGAVGKQRPIVVADGVARRGNRGKL